MIPCTASHVLPSHRFASKLFLLHHCVPTRKTNMYKCINTSTFYTLCALSKVLPRCDTTLLEHRERRGICLACKHLWFPPACCASLARYF
jgi:hypothetical protein